VINQTYGTVLGHPSKFFRDSGPKVNKLYTTVYHLLEEAKFILKTTLVLLFPNSNSCKHSARVRGSKDIP